MEILINKKAHKELENKGKKRTYETKTKRKKRRKNVSIKIY